MEKFKNILNRSSYYFLQIVFVLILILIYLSACSPGTRISATTSPTYRRTSSPISTLTITPTLIPSITSTATATQKPTYTPTIIPTPTPVLPVEMENGLPQLSFPITKDNISSIQEIGYWGSPQIRDFKITADGKYGFVATTAGVVVFDTQTKDIIDNINIIMDNFNVAGQELSISANGNRFVTLAGNKVVVWDIGKGIIFSQPLIAPNLNYLPQYPQISPDGKFLVFQDCPDAHQFNECFQSTKTFIYDIDLDQQINNLPDFGYGDLSPNRFYFSPRGTFFVEWIQYDVGVYGFIWNTNDWSKFREIRLKSMGEFSPYESLFAFQDAENILIYQVEPWKLVRQINAHLPIGNFPTTLYFSLDGDLLGIWGETEISVWRVSTGDEVSQYPLPVNNFEVTELNDDGTVYFYELPEEIAQYLNITDVGKWSDATLKYLDKQNALLVLKTVSHYDEHVMSIHDYDEACLIYISTQAKCQNYSDPAFIDQDGQLYSLHHTNDNEVFQVYLTNDDAKSIIGSFRSSSTYNLPIWISNDNKYLILGKGIPEYVELWDIQDQQMIKRWVGWQEHFTYSLDGRFLAFTTTKICGHSECGYELVVYDNIDNKIILDNSDGPFGPLEFTSAGILIYTTVENSHSNATSIQFIEFDPMTLEQKSLELSLLENQYFSIHDIAISPDSKLLTVGLPQGAVKIFNLDNLLEIYSWQAHHGEIRGLEFSADGTILWSNSILDYRGDGFIKAWGIWP